MRSTPGALRLPGLQRDVAIAVCETTIGHTSRMPEPVAILTVAITARALFHMEDSHGLFEAEGVKAYAEFQREREDDVLEPGIAFPLVRKLLALNDGTPADAPRVEVILLSRNSSDTGLRVFNSIQHHGLDIRRATFTSGAPVWPYIVPFGAQLFLSANPDSVRSALEAGVAAATILPARAPESAHDQLRMHQRMVLVQLECQVGLVDQVIGGLIVLEVDHFRLFGTHGLWPLIR